MVKYIIKRVLLALLILFCVSIILYFLVRCMPMSFFETKYADLLSTGKMSQEEYERILAIYGLEPVPTFGGILKGYFQWLGNALKGDFGTSFSSNDTVSHAIFKNMGVSFSISLISLILELIVAIPLGVKCACNQYGKLDYTATVLCMIGMAFPTFFLGNLFLKWFAVDLGWFPLQGLESGDTVGIARLGDMIWHLILPMVVLVILNVGPYMRYTRTNTLEVLNADYIRTARAKGLSERTVIYKHVFRNTLIPLVTLLSTTLPMLFGGAMITEQIFSINGIGNAAYQALVQGDIPFIMGYNMFIAVLTVVGVLLADFMYMVVDPRVKLN